MIGFGFASSRVARSNATRRLCANNSSSTRTFPDGPNRFDRLKGTSNNGAFFVGSIAAAARRSFSALDLA
jgi:hypothetical protein